jgi:DnaD/phage-associated family protein
LANRSTDGLASVRAGVRELQAIGHLRHTTIADKETGKILSHLWEVYETPHTGNSTLVAPQVGVDNQSAKNQSVDKPECGESHASIKYLSSKEQSNNTTTREKFGSVFATYETEIGGLNGHVNDCISDYLDNLHIPPEWLIESFHIAAEQNKRNWAYCAAILKRWAVEGKSALPPKVHPAGPRNPAKGSRAAEMKLLAEA